jgi:hypothetical protein
MQNFLISYSPSLFIFYSCLYFCITINFIIKVSILTWLSFLSIALTFLELLHSHAHFRIDSSISTKQSVEIVIKMALTLKVNLGQVWWLIPVISATQEVEV